MHFSPVAFCSWPSSGEAFAVGMTRAAHRRLSGDGMVATSSMQPFHYGPRSTKPPFGIPPRDVLTCLLVGRVSAETVQDAACSCAGSTVGGLIGKRQVMQCQERRRGVPAYRPRALKRRTLIAAGIGFCTTAFDDEFENRKQRCEKFRWPRRQLCSTGMGQPGRRQTRWRSSSRRLSKSASALSGSAPTNG